MLKRAPRLPPRMASMQYTAASLPVGAASQAPADSSIAGSAQTFCSQVSTFRQSLVDDMHRREEELKTKSRRLEKDMNELQHRLETVSRAEKRLAKVQRQLNEAEAALQAKNNELMQLTASHATMKQRIADLERRLESRAMNIVAAEGHITLERQRLAELKKKANDMVDEAVTAKEEAAKLCKRYLSDKAQLDEKNANYQFLQLENKELKRKLEELDRLNRVRDDEFSRLRVQQESEASRLKQDKTYIQRMDELYTAREAAIALRERELERMLKELEGLHRVSDSKTAQMELEHQKAKLEYKSTMDSLTYRIKAKDVELSKLHMENEHLRSVAANSLSIENAAELKNANKALSAHVEELTSHLLSVNSALDRLQTENLQLLEENRQNAAMLKELQKIVKEPQPNGVVAESLLSNRPLSPAARLAADRVNRYNSILSRSQPADGLRSAINRQKEANERLLDIQDLQQTGTTISKLSASSCGPANGVSRHSRGVEVALSVMEEVRTTRLRYERGMMKVEDSLSTLHRDVAKAVDAVSIKSQELQVKEEFIQQICMQIKADAEIILLDRQSLEQKQNDLENIIAEAVELRLQSKLALYEKERSAEILTPEFKRSFIEVLRLHKQMPEADAIYILERIISRATSVNRSNSMVRVADSHSGSTVKKSEDSASLKETLPLPSNSFRCEHCGGLNIVALTTSAPDNADKCVQTDAMVSELKEIWTLADQLHSSSSKLPVAASLLQSAYSSHPNISIQAAAATISGDLTRTEPSQTPLLRSNLSNLLESKPRYGRFSMLDTLKQSHAATMLSRTAADLSRGESEPPRGASTSASSKSSRSSRSHSLGRAASNPDTRSVRFSGVLEHVSSPHRGAGSRAATHSVILAGDSVQALDTYLRRGRNVTESARPVNLASSSETMTSLADPSPSTDRTPVTANTSSVSTTSIGSHDRPYYREAKQSAAEINRLLTKTESLTRKQLPIHYGDATHTSISAITKLESISAPQQIPASSTSNMTFTNLPDSQLLQRVEDILNRSGAESLTLDPPSMSHSGGHLEGHMGMYGSDVPRPFPPPSTSKFSTIYGLESPEGRQPASISDNIGGSDSCLYV